MPNKSRYRYTFLKAGSYLRKDGKLMNVFTEGAQVVAGYRAFKSNPNIQVTKLDPSPAPEPEETTE